MQETLIQFLSREDTLEKGWTTYSGILGASLVAGLVKNLACTAGHLGSTPGLGRSPGGGKGYPRPYSAGLENSMDCIVHGVAKSGTQLSDFHFTFLLRYLIAPSRGQFLMRAAASPHCGERHGFLAGLCRLRLPWRRWPGLSVCPLQG